MEFEHREETLTSLFAAAREVDTLARRVNDCERALEAARRDLAAAQQRNAERVRTVAHLLTELDRHTNGANDNDGNDETET